jgi:hypothetical protein
LLLAPQSNELGIDGEELGERVAIGSSTLEQWLELGKSCSRNSLNVFSALDAVGQSPERVPLA